MKNILFDCRSWMCSTFDYPHKYFQEHKEHNIEPVSVFHNSLELKRFGDGKKNIELITDYWEIGKNKYDLNALKDLEKKYNLLNLWNIIYADRFIKNWTKEKIVEQISFYFYAWEQIIKKYNPAYVFNETVTGLWNYTLFAVAKYNSIPYLGMLPTKNTQKYFFTRDVYGHFPEFESKYKHLLDRDLTNEELNSVNLNINQFRNNKIVPLHTKKHTELPTLKNIFEPYDFLKDVIKDLRDYGFKHNFDYKIGLRTLSYEFQLKRWYRTRFILKGKQFIEPDFSEKYILFPLQYQPEATTEIWASYYSNQLNLIEQIARSIPFDHVLYVKEHSHFLGTKSIDFYKKLSCLPNVKLINPLTDVYELIKNSKLIIVITATTGLEAIFWNKPVIIFGNIFYDFYPYVYRIKDITQLPTTILAALNQNVDENDDFRLKFLSAYFKSGYDINLFKTTFSENEKEGIIKVIVNELRSSNK